MCGKPLSSYQVEVKNGLCIVQCCIAKFTCPFQSKNKHKMFDTGNNTLSFDYSIVDISEVPNSLNKVKIVICVEFCFENIIKLPISYPYIKVPPKFFRERKIILDFASIINNSRMDSLRKTLTSSTFT